MSYGLYSILAKNVYFATSLSTKGNPGWELMVSNLERWVELQAEPPVQAFPSWYTNNLDADLGSGWYIKKSIDFWETLIGVQDELFVCVVRKNDMIVFGVDSSHYNDGEIGEMVYFSENSDHLDSFLRDFFPGESASKNGVVEQWM